MTLHTSLFPLKDVLFQRLYNPSQQMCTLIGAVSKSYFYRSWFFITKSSVISSSDIYPVSELM
ncbi:hypothetical protein EG68_00714 [Paragonimus skrjabini miyazakii]|uniref:Uncharacterized protein n=1 Tax=Paragonimus skrjabini miyazakii TaxID=59628 RepID=A0A8S9Z3I0_9TREM|nr:hypothetical protein EG68_00714 [Paragonimus skrjabini miyazakii]